MNEACTVLGIFCASGGIPDCVRVVDIAAPYHDVRRDASPGHGLVRPPEFRGFDRALGDRSPIDSSVHGRAVGNGGAVRVHVGRRANPCTYGMLDPDLRSGDISAHSRTWDASGREVAPRSCGVVCQ